MLKLGWIPICGVLTIFGATGSVTASVPDTAFPELPTCATTAPLSIGIAGQWEALRLRGGPLVAGTRITAQFQEDRVSGSAGCNRYWGNYQALGQRFRLTSGIATTRKACLQPGVMEQEASYVAALEEARTYAYERGVLILRNADGNVLVELVSFEGLED